MRPLSEKEAKIAMSMFAKAEEYQSLKSSVEKLEENGLLLLKQFETHLETLQIQISDDHTFRFLGAVMRSKIEIDFALKEVAASLTVYHVTEKGMETMVCSIPFDDMGNTLYAQKFPVYIVGTLINYLQFNF